MYKVECDGTIIFDDTSLLQNVILIDPVLELSDNSAGKFTFTIPPSNIGYNLCKKITSTIVIKKENKWFWEGRILLESLDFLNRKKITCEGALAYLNDIILTPDCRNGSIELVISNYNSKADNNRKLKAGLFDKILDDNGKEVKFSLVDGCYETAWEYIKTKVLDIYGGHIYVERTNTGLKSIRVHYKRDYNSNVSQTIDFGVNLLDFTRDYDFSNICTVCIPRGKQLDNGVNENLTEEGASNDHKKNEYLTIESVNGGSIYLKNDELFETYGRIEKIVDFNDVDDPQVLLDLGKEYMKSVQFDDMSLTVKAVDLHILNKNLKSLNMLDRVRCVSVPHGLDKYFPITGMSIPLDHPENTEYTMGTIQSSSISSLSSSAKAAVNEKLTELPTRESVLNAAMKDAEQILSAKTQGYVNIISQGNKSQALIISSSLPYTDSDHYWKFDMGGLGYYYKGKLHGVAITYNGEINANFITTGTLSANLVRTGVIEDTSGNEIINLNTGKVSLNANDTTVKVIKNGQTIITKLASLDDITEINGTVKEIKSQQSSIYKSINEISTSVSNLEACYAECDTAGDAKNKQATCVGLRLVTGSVVIVNFKYANTASKPTIQFNGGAIHPITLNNKRISDSKYYWGPNQTVHLVYNERRAVWEMANGATESHIRQLADSISLSVTGKLGGTASIILNADGDNKVADLDMREIRKTFADDPSSITIKAGRIAFQSGTFSLSSSNCSISTSGIIRAQSVRLDNFVDIDYADDEYEAMEELDRDGYYYTTIRLQPRNGIVFRRVYTEEGRTTTTTGAYVQYDPLYDELKINCRGGVTINGHEF